MKTKRLPALILTLAMLLSLFTFALATETEEPELPDAEAILGAEPGGGDTPDGDEPDDGEGEDENTPPAEKYQDLTGHWAETTMRQAIEDGLLNGFPDGTARPDDAITSSQMIAILTRVLGAVKTDYEGLPFSSDTWYYELGAKANFLGILPEGVTNLDNNMLRQDAFSLMAKAFTLTPAIQDLTALSAYSDAAKIKDANKAAFAALVSSGLVQGYAGALSPNGTISRAEFLTVVYRVADSYVTQAELPTKESENGLIVKGDVNVYSVKAKAPIWLDCSSKNVFLRGLETDRLTLRSDELKSFSIDSSVKIDRLVIACGSADISLGALFNVKLNTVQLQSGGSLTLTDSVIENIEITGSNQTVSISGTHEKLIVSGSNNIIKLEKNFSLDEIIVTGNGNAITNDKGQTINPNSRILSFIEINGDNNKLDLAIAFGEDPVDDGSDGMSGLRRPSAALALRGSTNTVIIDNSRDFGEVSLIGGGGYVQLSGGSVGSVKIEGDYNTFITPASEKEVSIPKIEVTSKSNLLKLGEGTSVRELTLAGSANKMELGGYIETITITARKSELTGSGSADKLILNASGCTIDIAVRILEDNSRDFDVDRVLGLVSYTYKGNYTLAWAQEHDYEDYEKEIWVNARNYSSKTEYLIWINLAMQRVNIFKGSQGDWTLDYSCIVATGAPGSGTPVGVYYTTYLLASGWTTGSYTCKPVVGFKAGSGYAFHSRLYYPNSSTLKDPSIGFPVSAGCVRMYDEDINHIYNNIPLNTTVVVY